MKPFDVIRNLDGAVIKTIFHTCVTNATKEFVAGIELPRGTDWHVMSRLLALVWHRDGGRVVVDYHVELCRD